MEVRKSPKWASAKQAILTTDETDKDGFKKNVARYPHRTQKAQRIGSEL
jgi:hypothetical protein